MSALIFDVESLTVPAEDVRPGNVIREDDGRTRTVRDAYRTIGGAMMLVYTAGPSDVFRRSYPLTLVDSSDD